MPNQLSQQEQLFGIQESDFGTLSASNERLYPFLNAVEAITQEAKLHPTDGGLSVMAVDPANVVIVDATIELSGDVPDDTVGVDVGSLAGSLQNKPRDADVEVECALPNGVLRLDEQIANGRVWNVREAVRFMDPDAVRDEPDIPDLEFSAAASLEPQELLTFLRRIPDNTHVELRANGDELEFRGAADDDAATDAEYHTVATTKIEEVGDAVSLYSTDYFIDVIESVQRIGADTVRLSWSEEFPVRFEAEGEHTESTFYLAPRIQS